MPVMITVAISHIGEKDTDLGIEILKSTIPDMDNCNHERDFCDKSALKIKDCIKEMLPDMIGFDLTKEDLQQKNSSKLN